MIWWDGGLEIGLIPSIEYYSLLPHVVRLGSLMALTMVDVNACFQFDLQFVGKWNWGTEKYFRAHGGKSKAWFRRLRR